MRTPLPTPAEQAKAREERIRKLRMGEKLFTKIGNTHMAKWMRAKLEKELKNGLST